MEISIPKAMLDSTNLSAIKDYDEYRQALEAFLQDDHIFDPLFETSLTIIWILFILTGLITNSILIAVIMLSKNLRTPNTLLLLNLFVADVMNTLFSMPFTLATILHRSWPLGTFLCKLVPFIQFNTAFVTAGTVTAIAIDRQLRIVGSYNRVSRAAFRRPVYGLHMSITIWLGSLLLSSPILYFQTLETALRVGSSTLELCHEVWPNSTLRMIYNCVVYGFFIFVPTTSLGVSYQRIRSYLKSNGIDRRRQTNILTKSGMNENQIVNMIKKFDFLQKEINCNTKVTVILFMGILVYVLSWLPLCVYNLYVDLFQASISISGSEIALSTIVFHVIAITSATTNAFIYGYLNTNIQKELSCFIEKSSPLKCFSWPAAVNRLNQEAKSTQGQNIDNV